MFVASGNDVFQGTMPLGDALKRCMATPVCASVTFNGSPSNGQVYAFGKSVSLKFVNTEWTTYVKLCT